MQEKLHKIR